MKRYFVTSLLAGSILFTSCSSNNQPATPEGKVKLESITVAPKIAGRVATIFVSEGQAVSKGDTLAIIDVPEITAKLEQANGAILSAEGQFSLAQNGATGDQLLQVQSQLDAAEAQLVYAEQSFHRMENMFNDSLVPAQKYDEVKSTYIAAKAQVNAIKAKQKEVSSGTRPETIRAAKGQVERALGARNEVLIAAAERYMIAPADMIIESITLKAGELATPGYTIFNGYDSAHPYFRFTMGEKNINAYPLGTVVTVTVPNTNKKIKGKIAMVKQLPRYADNTSTAPNRAIGESFYELKVLPDTAADAAGLYNNSSVFLDQ